MLHQIGQDQIGLQHGHERTELARPFDRERAGDIAHLARYFWHRLADPGTPPEEAFIERLRDYPWPGNVRELKAVVELAAVMTNEDHIEAGDIRFSSSRGMTDLLLEESTLKDYTEKIITHFLDKYDNNVLLVARKLDIGKSTIYRMLKRA